MKKMRQLIAILCVGSLMSTAPLALAETVQFETTLGAMKIEVDEENAPITAENFIQYVRDGFYDGLIFHRVIPDFVVQGGGLTAEMKPREGRPPIANEDGNGLKNARYSLSMARTQNPDSATSQFFINLKDNAFLDADPAQGKRGYAVFGKVVEGQEVVDAIAAVPTGTAGHFRDVPTTPVVIIKAIIVQ